MRLFGEVGCTSDDVVLAVFYLVNEGCSFMVHHDVYMVTYRNGIGTSNAFQTEIAFDFTIYQLSVVGLYHIPTTCILDD